MPRMIMVDDHIMLSFITPSGKAHPIYHNWPPHKKAAAIAKPSFRAVESR